MKKPVVFLIAVLYLALTSGIAVNIHYCMGRMAKVTYGTEADHQCDKCGMEKKTGCCETEHKFVKADDDHIYSSPLTAGVPDAAVTVSQTSLLDASSVFSRDRFTSLSHPPPGIPQRGLYVLHSVFRI